ncbi:hypothetical protein GCM10010464_43370 [Pseudonocardia yunnanensis]
MTGFGGRPVRSVWVGYVVIAVVVALWAALVACGDRGDHTGPAATDFVPIADVSVAAPAVAPENGSSTGTFREDCGRNERGIHNSDNIIISPGVTGGAHHAHDYVGNVSTNAFSTDASLAAADTTCADGDRSTYFWPVLLAPGGSAGQGNSGHGGNLWIQVPQSVLIEFRGSPVSNVVAMPRFLDAFTGNPHAVTEGGAGAEHVQWSCSGDRTRITRQYPLCDEGQQVIRIFDFPSCWNGKTLDSPNHKSHLVYPDAGGACPGATFPVPQLHIELAYAVPSGARYAVDSFPEELRNPITDHAGFINVMPDELMTTVAECINSGRQCTS